MNITIQEKGGIDLMLVGIGMNGHIGFNEPGIAVNQYAHVVALDADTRTVGQKYFSEQTVLTDGITLGLKHLLEAGKVLLVANGHKKAEVIRKALEEEITTLLPASIIRDHPNSCVMLDEAASSALTTRRNN
jgi:galactosamine-6-phosphate isomerase